MVGLRFNRSVGPAADVKELQFVIALHQTCAPDTRENATVGSVDIARLLASRHGLHITSTQAEDLVRSLGGGDTIGKAPIKKKTPSAIRFGLFSKKQALSTTQVDGEVPALSASRLGALLHHSSTHSSMENNNNSRLLESASLGSRQNGGLETNSSLLSEAKEELADPSQYTEEIDELDDRDETEEEAVVVEDTFTNDMFSEQYLDMVQLLSTLLIPTFARAVREYKVGVDILPPIPEPKTNSWFSPFSRLVWRLRTMLLHREQTVLDSLRASSDGSLLQQILQIMVTKTGESEPTVDEDFVRRLLVRYGEFERAENIKLVQQMVEMASSPSGLFDEEALANAVASDLTQWDVPSEGRLSSMFYDIFNESNPHDVKNLEADDLMSGADEEVAEKKEPTKCAHACCKCFSCVFGRCRASPLFMAELFNIDMVVDCHSSTSTVALIWVFYIMSSGVYGIAILAQPDIKNNCNLEDVWCKIFQTIFSWVVVMVVLSALGVLVLMPLSLGNNPYSRNSRRQLYAVGAAVVYAVVPFVLMNVFGGETKNDEERAIDSDEFRVLREFTMILGLILAGLFLIQMFLSSLRLRRGISKRRAGVFDHITSTSNTRGEARLKHAATRKTRKIMENAISVHSIDTEAALRGTPQQLHTQQTAVDTSTMRNFILHGERYELAGGTMWTWLRILDGSLFDTEGIWLNTRLIVLQMAQVIVAVVFSYLLFLGVGMLAESAGNARDDLKPEFPNWVSDVVPTPRMVRVSLYPATIAAIVVMVLLISLYIPSAVSTILKYRSQFLPSLGSPYFVKYRAAVDYTFVNTANAIYGMIGAASLYWLMVGCLIFLCVWPFSQDLMIQILAWSLGIGATVILKMVGTTLCRALQYRCFYRIHPRAASFTSLLLECWYIGLGSSVLIGRITQFLFAAAFWVGRIDVPFLSEDVCLFGYSFDYVPTHFAKDLLVHEAHRHPYIERLSQIYLMKLRHKAFVSDAGAAWRQLIVVTLFPWLTKYRLFNEERVKQPLLIWKERQHEEGNGEEGNNGAPGGTLLLAEMKGVATEPNMLRTS